MRLFHISDLHIGKQLRLYNLRDDQEHILNQIVERAKEYRPNAILIAGDIYDKSVPSGEAYTLFDDFLNDLADIKPEIPVLIIAGNHDSAERLNYASSFLERHQIYISTMPPQAQGEYLKKVVLPDNDGQVNFYLLPFTKPAFVRHLIAAESGDEKRSQGLSYDEAVRYLLERENVDSSERNILVAHQFFVNADTKPETCESETVSVNVGGLDSVDISCLDAFDYVALGHIHGPQKVGRETIRYSGTPLKYSVSEQNHTKGITMVELGAKGEPVEIEQIPLKPLRDVRRIAGKLEEVVAASDVWNRSDYVEIVLNDEEEIFHVKEKLEEYYDNILEVRVENSRTQHMYEDSESDLAELNPLEAFCRFYKLMNNDADMTEDEIALMQSVIEKVRGQGE